MINIAHSNLFEKNLGIINKTKNSMSLAKNPINAENVEEDDWNPSINNQTVFNKVLVDMSGLSCL